MEIYRDLSRPAARSEQDNGGGKIGENKENIEHHDDAQQPQNERRTISMAGRPRGLRERRITSPQQGEPNSMGEKGDPVEVSQRTVLEDVTHRYNSSYEETMNSDEESMMDTSSRETALQENATPPQHQTRHLSSHPYRGGSPRFTRNMR